MVDARGSAQTRGSERAGGTADEHWAGPGTGRSTGGERDAVGPLIRGARRRAGLSLEDLARRAGCARSHLSQVETGKKHAGHELLERLEEGLNLPPGMLVQAASMSRAPGVVRQRMDDLERRTAAARRLAEILRGSGIGDDGRIRGSLDVAHRSGELRELVQRIAPEHGAGEAGGSAGGAIASTAATPGAKGARGAARAGGTKHVKGAKHGGKQPGGKAGTRSGSTPAEIEAAAPVDQAMPRVVPLINRVAAGLPSDFTDLGYPARIADEYIRTADTDDPDAFAARITGDSMAPDYREGDIVVFSPRTPAASGDDCFVRLEPDHESTFKRVFFEKEPKGRQVVRLQAINPKYPGRVVDREGVAGVYPAVSVSRRVGKR